MDRRAAASSTDRRRCAIYSENFKKTFRVYGEDKAHPPAVLVRAMNDFIARTK